MSNKQKQYGWLIFLTVGLVGLWFSDNPYIAFTGLAVAIIGFIAGARCAFAA